MTKREDGEHERIWVQEELKNREKLKSFRKTTKTKTNLAKESTCGKNGSESRVSTRQSRRIRSVRT